MQQYNQYLPTKMVLGHIVKCVQLLSMWSKILHFTKVAEKSRHIKHILFVKCENLFKRSVFAAIQQGGKRPTTITITVAIAKALFVYKRVHRVLNRRHDK